MCVIKKVVNIHNLATSGTNFSLYLYTYELKHRMSERMSDFLGRA